MINVDRVLGDRPFAEIGAPVLAVADERRGLQPGGAFVVRRDLTTGEPRWVFRADHQATDLDADDDTAYVTYRHGELVALDLRDGTVRFRRSLPVFPTAVTVPAPGRLLVGGSDGRIISLT